MSQEYNHHHHHHHHHPQQNASSIYSFPNGFDRSTEDQSTTTDDPTGAGLNPAVYESAGMLSEMFNFGHEPGANAGPSHPPELLDYRREDVGGISNQEWYGPRHNIGDHHHHHQQQQHHHHDLGGGINAHNSVAAMQLFLTNAPPRSPSPPPPPPPPGGGGGGGGFHSLVRVTSNNPNFWGPPPINNPGELSGIVEGQEGLSLSLSSSLQHLEAAKQAEHNHIMFFNQQHPSSSATNTSSSNTHFFKNLTNTTPGPQPQNPNPIMIQNLHSAGGFMGSGQGPSTSSVGFGSTSTSASLGVVNALRISKYAKPAQELLEEFCSVGRGHQLGRQNSSNNLNSATSGGGRRGGAAESSSSKDPPPQLSPADRIEHQRRKVKLVAMLDEVDGRYNHYCEQMQMVVNSFDLVMGHGAAIPYTALAQKAMSRHFRCLKDAIHTQLKHSCELLGEKDPTASSGLTKGETPRLKALEQSLRQQRAFHQMGMMDQDAWRPQRGLPERSVNILRAWLFEHFLNPYPSDADKHLLARQTGLSRNQVSNWFINARVRLWKPMVEEMYQQESKDNDDYDNQDDPSANQTSSSTSNNNNNNNSSSFPTTQQQQQQPPCVVVAQNPMPSTSVSQTLQTEGERSADETMHPTPPDCDPSLLPIINTRQHLQFHPPPPSRHVDASGLPSSGAFLDDTGHFDHDVGPTTMIRFGGTPGDVSLTLGLRHAGNAPEKNNAPNFSVRDFGS